MGPEAEQHRMESQRRGQARHEARSGPARMRAERPVRGISPSRPGFCEVPVGRIRGERMGERGVDEYRRLYE